MPRKSNISPVGRYARRILDDAIADGVTNKGELKRIYRNAFERGRKSRDRKPSQRSLVSIITNCAIAELKAAGVTDAKELKREKITICQRVERRLAGKRRIGPYRKHPHKLTREEYNAIRREGYRKCLARQLQRSRQRRLKHPKYLTNYVLKRIRSDPEFAMACRLRSLVKHRLGARKGESRTFDILGCSPKFFGNWIQSHFTKGMTWKNRKLWDIGHIFPSSACVPDEIALSFHYRNLKPQWKSDNIAARNKITGDGLVSAFLCGIRSIVIKSDWQIAPVIESHARAIGFTIIKPPTTNAN